MILKNITLVAIDCLNPVMACKALKHSCRSIRFYDTLLFSSQDISSDTIKTIKIAPITSLEDYSRFCIERLASYIESDVILTVHSDGFIINPHLWNDEFSQYDYIGAPWPPDAPWCTRNRVGNGGFSLRSKKFMEIASKLGQFYKHEDILLTNICYDSFVEAGCRYAPVEVAMRFALEAKIPECAYSLDNCFGFHGKGDAFYHYGQGQQFKDRIALLDSVSLGVVS